MRGIKIPNNTIIKITLYINTLSVMRKLLYLTLLSIFFWLPYEVEAQIKLTNLTIEGRQTPIGLDETHPRFGWQILSPRRNVVQKTYRIVVASSLVKLEHNEGDIWDSGVIKTDSSQWIALPHDRQLQPGHEYFWKVQISTNKGKSAWSQTAKWCTGVCHN